MLKMTSYVSDDKGMTLVEILVAITILCVGLLAVAILFPTSSTNIDYGGKMSKGMALGQEKIEEFRNTPFDSITGGNDAPTGYTRTWTVSDAGSAPFRLRTVTVTVSWIAVGRPDNVVLQTFVAENKS
jgi:prepilin-type N-terminal cleavage/methylation domain-containing protein